MEQPAAADALIGREIGNYVVKNKLGEGGMGSVYLAEHPLIGKKVALKVLHAEFASNEDVVSRFFNEAKAVNDIQHPNIVDIVDYGVLKDQHGGNMVYFIMEFLEGPSLADVVRTEAPLAPERALSICLQIADALGSSHSSGIIHRDLKPDNVILITRGRSADFVKVLDFGIAKLTGDQPGSRRTRTGIVMGTPAYMSPEQCEGRGNIDHRTDIYALGILLYEMITGRVPFLGEGYGEVLVQHLTQAPQRPSTIRGVIPPHVEAVVMKALEKKPDQRFPTMEEFMKALADPVGYVESHGGLAGFGTEVLVPSMTAPPLSVVTPTPMPIAPLTPSPGSLYAMTPAPGMVSPVPGAVHSPTTLSGGAGQMTTGLGYAPPRSKLPLIIASAAAVIAIAVGAVVLLGGGGNEKTAAATPEEKPEPRQPEVVPEPKVPTPEPPPKVDPPVDTVGEGKADPTPAPAPKVKIKIEANIKGAEIYLNDDSEPVGETPMTLELDKGPEKIKVTLKRRGYRDKEKTIVADGNKSFEWRMSRMRGRPPREGDSGDRGDSGKSGNPGTIGDAVTLEPTFGD